MKKNISALVIAAVFLTTVLLFTACPADADPGLVVKPGDPAFWFEPVYQGIISRVGGQNSNNYTGTVGSAAGNIASVSFLYTTVNGSAAWGATGLSAPPDSTAIPATCKIFLQLIDEANGMTGGFNHTTNFAKSAYATNQVIDVTAVTAAVNTLLLNNGTPRFMVVRDSGYPAYSTNNGTSWSATSGTNANNQAYRSVAYGGGSFVMTAGGNAGSRYAGYSTNGTSWTVSATGMPATANWNSVCFGQYTNTSGQLANRFVAVALNSNWAAYSADGGTWQSATLPGSEKWTSVCYGAGKYVTIARDSAKAAYSNDGVTWIETTLPVDAEWYDIVYGNGRFAAIAYKSDIAAVSTDGINWMQTKLPSTRTWTAVTHGNGIFVAVSATIHAAYSADGITWQAGQMPISATYVDVCYGNGRFVAVTGQNTNRMASSRNGSTWTAVTNQASGNWNAITYGN